MNTKQTVLLVNIAGTVIDLDWCASGYFNGSISIGHGTVGHYNSVWLHVEAIEASIKKGSTRAANSDYQSVIDNWLIRNDGCAPHLLKAGKKQYFVNVEVFAK